MLEALHIRGFVLIRSADAEFSGGFGVFTGETGAGKSILVDALQAVCGARTTRAAASQRGGRAEISAQFALGGNARAGAWLRDNEMDDAGSDAVVIRRVLGGNGSARARCYINGRPAPLGQVRELASLLIDIHGQHDSLRLLEPAHQRDLVDGRAGCAALRREVARAHADLAAALRRRDELAQDSRQRGARAELLRAELADLEGIGFSAEKWREADTLQRRHHAAEEVRSGLAEVASLLDEQGAVAALESARRAAGAVARHDARAGSLTEMLDQILELAGDLSRETEKLAMHAGDEGDIAEAEAFLSEAHRLMRRHKVVAPEALEDRMRALRAELAELEEATDAAGLDRRIAELQAALDKAAAELTRKRRAAAKKISPAVTATLADLGMPGAVFRVELEARETAVADGKERVRFLISTRKGSAAGELGAVASGGELSRVGLAVMAALDAPGEDSRTMVFDEVDAGIGGEVATVVGRVLKDLAAKCGQVLCVTHLPQIASLADEHWGVEACESGGKPAVRLRRLGGEELKSEMVRMLGGEDVGDTARLHADSLLRMGRRSRTGRSSDC